MSLQGPTWGSLGAAKEALRGARGVLGGSFGFSEVLCGFSGRPRGVLARASGRVFNYFICFLEFSEHSEDLTSLTHGRIFIP